MSPGSRQIPSWFSGVVVSYASTGGLSHLVAGGFRFSTLVLARALFSFTSVSLVMFGSMVWQIRGIPITGVISYAAVAVVLGAAELVWLDQWQKHRRLGFLSRERPVRSCISWKRYADDVVVGSHVFCCSCIFVFLRACAQCQSRWYREQIRLSMHG